MEDRERARADILVQASQDRKAPELFRKREMSFVAFALVVACFVFYGPGAGFAMAIVVLFAAVAINSVLWKHTKLN